MNRRSNLKKVAAIAVAYYLNESKEKVRKDNTWVDTGRSIHMLNRITVQQKGKVG